MTPPEVITGNTGYDRDIGFFEALSRKRHQNSNRTNHSTLFSSWLQVPLSDLTSGSFTFTPADDPGLEDPSPDLGPDAPGVTGSLGFDGTTGVDGTGTGDYMPWAGDTFQLNLLGPFEDFYNSLFDAPTGGIDGTGVELPSRYRTFSTVPPKSHRGLRLSPSIRIVAGSPACPGVCDLPAGDDPTGSVARRCSRWDPTNTSLSASYVGRLRRD